MPKLIIPQSLLEQFRGNLHPKPSDVIDDVVMDLDSLSADEAITVRGLPLLIPIEVRREIANKSKEVIALQRDLSVMIDQLMAVADKEAERKEAEEEAAKPHCEMCGQVVKNKPRSKKKK